MEILSSRILLRPTDFARSVRFYREGLGLHPFREFDGGVVFFLGGGFLEVSGRGGGRRDGSLEVWLQVRSVDDAHARLLAIGARVDVPPVDEPWGLRELRARDPDGVRLVFVEVPDDHPLRRDTRGGSGRRD